MLTEIAGMITGITVTTLVVITVIILMLTESRNRRIRQKLLHDERMLALEKGLPVPADYLDSKPKRRPYVRGMVLCAIGLGCMVIYASNNGGDNPMMGIGSIFVFIGIALIIGDRIAASHNKE